MNTLVPTKHSSLLTKYARSFLAGLFVVSLVPWTSAQTPAADAFNPSANGPVYALAMQPDGSLLVGGNFSYIGGTYRPYLARFSTDGTLDSSFTPGITTQNGGFPCALAVQPDGKILVGGDFVAVDGLAYTNFARLTIDGSVDTNFLGQADGEVNTLAVQPDGKILVGGGFTSVGGATSSFLTRLNADGSRDTSFNPHITAEVYTINVLSDGKLLIGGMFTLLGGSGGPSYFARLLSDGSLDASFNPVVNYFVHSSAVQTDGKIVVGGRFNAMCGVTRNHLGRLNADGTIDADFNPNPNGIVFSLAVQADQQILAGGTFTTLGGQSRTGFGRLTPTGSLDTNFTAQVDVATIDGLALQQDGRLVVCGGFNTLAGVSRMNIGRLTSFGVVTNALSFENSTLTWHRSGPIPDVWRTTFEVTTNGVDWSVLGVGTRITNGWQLSSLSAPQGLVRVRGFTSSGMFGGSGGIVELLTGAPVVAVPPVASTNNAGDAASFFVSAIGPEPLFYQWRREGTPLANGDAVDGATNDTLTLYGLLGGDAGGYDVIVSNTWGSVTSLVAELTVQDPFIQDNPSAQNAHLGGSATFSVTAAGTSLAYQWRKDGEALANGTDPVFTLANAQVADVGTYDVIVSGTYGCVTSEVAALSVNLAATSPGFAPFSDGNVASIAVQPDGKTLVAGSYLRLNGDTTYTSYSIVRLNADGTLDKGFNPTLNGWNHIYTQAVQPNGKIVIGGSFNQVNDEPRQNIARFNADGSLDETFAPNASGTVQMLALQADGSILVGGTFSTLGGASHANIGRLDATGAVDSNFLASADGTVRTLAIQSDGTILVGGYFTTLNGESRACLGRLNSDGTLDTAFNPGATSSSYCVVDALAQQTNGAILVGGYFDTLGGASCINLGRLLSDGTPDTTFAPAPDGEIQSLALQANGKIIVGGSFYTLATRSFSCAARLSPDGTPDANFTPSVIGSVQAVAVQANGGILVGGSIWTLNGNSQVAFGRLLNSDPPTEQLTAVGDAIVWLRGGGAPEVWRTVFESTTDSGASWSLVGIGSRVAGGWRLDSVSVPAGTLRARGFTLGGKGLASAGIVESGLGLPLIENPPISITNLAGTAAAFSVSAIGSAPLYYQWRKDGVALTDGNGITGSVAAALTFGAVFGGDSGAYDVIVSNDFGSVTSVAATLTVRDPVILTQPSSRSCSLGDQASLSVTAAGSGLSYQWFKDDQAVAGATDSTLTVTSVQATDVGFYQVTVAGTYGAVTSSVVAVEANLISLDPAFAPNADYTVEAIASQPDGSVLIGGGFANVQSTAYACIARLARDGTPDATFNPGADGWVYTLAVQPDGGILVGGDFATLAGDTRAYIGRLLTNGTLDVSFNPGADGHVGTLLVQADGKILVGGTFATIASTARANLARLNADGTIDSAFQADTDGQVWTLAAQADGKILVGGSFATLGGASHLYLGRLNPDGSPDGTFTPTMDGQVSAIAVQPDGKILIGGFFYTVNGSSHPYLARLHADGSLDTTFAATADYGVKVIALQADGKILVGGEFYNVNSKTHHYLARLTADGLCDPSFGPALGGDEPLDSLALQADGKILVGGRFTTMNGSPIPYFGRFLNTSEATGILTNDTTSATWLRGDAAPEVWRTTFEVSNNNADWTALGDGVRTNGGWRVSSVSIPTSSSLSLMSLGLGITPLITIPGNGGSTGSSVYIRARGYVASGLANGCGGIVETVLVVTVFSSSIDTDGDGIPDWWTTQYFGHPTGQAKDLSRATDDPSGCGQDNYFKYIAGLDPTNAASVFRLDIAPVSGASGEMNMTFSPRQSDRSYTLQYCTNLSSAVWSDLPSATTKDSGTQRTVTDLDATAGTKFYRVKITLP